MTLLVSCVHRDLPEFDRQLEADMTVSLFDPIYKGPEVLAQNFEHESYDPVIYSIETEGIRIIVRQIDNEKITPYANKNKMLCCGDSTIPIE